MSNHKEPVAAVEEGGPTDEPIDCEGCNKKDCEACRYNEANPPTRVHPVQQQAIEAAEKRHATRLEEGGQSVAPEPHKFVSRQDFPLFCKECGREWDNAVHNPLEKLAAERLHAITNSDWCEIDEANAMAAELIILRSLAPKLAEQSAGAAAPLDIKSVVKEVDRQFAMLPAWKQKAPFLAGAAAPSDDKEEIARLKTLINVSYQQTLCCVCLVVKHTPVRNDELGGYVCGGCLEKAYESATAQVASLTQERDKALHREEVNIEAANINFARAEKSEAERDRLKELVRDYRGRDANKICCCQNSPLGDFRCSLCKQADILAPSEGEK